MFRHLQLNTAHSEHIVLAPRAVYGSLCPRHLALNCMIPCHPPRTLQRLVVFSAFQVMLCHVDAASIVASFLSTPPSACPPQPPQSTLTTMAGQHLPQAPWLLTPTQPVCLGLTNLPKRGLGWGRAPKPVLWLTKYSSSRDFPTACERFSIEVWGQTEGHKYDEIPNSFLSQSYASYSKKFHVYPLCTELERNSNF